MLSHLYGMPFAGLMCLAFGLCFSVMMLWLTMRVATPHLVQIWHGHASYILLSCNSAMNPLIYGLACSDYRRSLHNIIPKNLFSRRTASINKSDNSESVYTETSNGRRISFGIDLQMNVYTITQHSEKNEPLA